MNCSKLIHENARLAFKLKASADWLRYLLWEHWTATIYILWINWFLTKLAKSFEMILFHALFSGRQKGPAGSLLLISYNFYKLIWFQFARYLQAVGTKFSVHSWWIIHLDESPFESRKMVSNHWLGYAMPCRIEKKNSLFNTILISCHKSFIKVANTNRSLK